MLPSVPATPAEAKVLRAWFAAFDERQLPATWATLGPGGDWTLAQGIIESLVPHELAYHLPKGALAEFLPELETQAALAQRAALPLRTMVHSIGGIHPAVIARLGVAALVSLDSHSFQRQSSHVRSHGWGQWEVLPSDVVPQALCLTESTQLIARIFVAKRDDARLHFLWPLADLTQAPRSPALRLLDCAGNLAHRNQIEVATLGRVAERASGQRGTRAA